MNKSLETLATIEAAEMQEIFSSPFIKVLHFKVISFGIKIPSI